MESSHLNLTHLLFEALNNENVLRTETLLNNGADPNLILPIQGASPMHIAAGLDKEFLKLLLRNNGDPNVRSVDGITPLHIAATWGNVDNLKILLYNGGDPYLLDQDGSSPLDVAKHFQHVDCAVYLQYYCLLLSAEQDAAPKYTYTMKSDLGVPDLQRLKSTLHNHGHHVALDVTSPDHPYLLPKNSPVKPCKTTCINFSCHCETENMSKSPCLSKTSSGHHDLCCRCSKYEYNCKKMHKCACHCPSSDETLLEYPTSSHASVCDYKNKYQRLYSQERTLTKSPYDASVCNNKNKDPRLYSPERTLTKSPYDASVYDKNKDQRLYSPDRTLSKNPYDATVCDYKNKDQRLYSPDRTLTTSPYDASVCVNKNKDQRLYSPDRILTKSPYDASVCDNKNKDQRLFSPDRTLTKSSYDASVFNNKNKDQRLYSPDRTLTKSPYDASICNNKNKNQRLYNPDRTLTKSPYDGSVCNNKNKDQRLYSPDRTLTKNPYDASVCDNKNKDQRLYSPDRTLTKSPYDASVCDNKYKDQRLYSPDRTLTKNPYDVRYCSYNVMSENSHKQSKPYHHTVADCNRGDITHLGECPHIRCYSPHQKYQQNSPNPYHKCSTTNSSPSFCDQRCSPMKDELYNVTPPSSSSTNRTDDNIMQNKIHIDRSSPKNHSVLSALYNRVHLGQNGSQATRWRELIDRNNISSKDFHQQDYEIPSLSNVNQNYSCCVQDKHFVVEDDEKVSVKDKRVTGDKRKEGTCCVKDKHVVTEDKVIAEACQGNVHSPPGRISSDFLCFDDTQSELLQFNNNTCKKRESSLSNTSSDSFITCPSETEISSRPMNSMRKVQNDEHNKVKLECFKLKSDKIVKNKPDEYKSRQMSQFLDDVEKSMYDTQKANQSVSSELPVTKINSQNLKKYYEAYMNGSLSTDDVDSTCELPEFPWHLQSTLKDSKTEQKLSGDVKTLSNEVGKLNFSDYRYNNTCEISIDTTPPLFNDGFIDRRSSWESYYSDVSTIDYTYTDTEEGITLVEKWVPSSVCDKGIKSDDNSIITISSLDSQATVEYDWRAYAAVTNNYTTKISSDNVPDKFMALTDDEIRSQLISFGDDPAPITASTRQTFLRRLTRLSQDPDSVPRLKLGSTPDKFMALTDDEIRSQLISFGDDPAPITASTRRTFLRRLTRLSQDPDSVPRLKLGSTPEYSRELQQSLKGDDTGLVDVETKHRAMSDVFQTQQNTRKWREGCLKSSFNYILLDPRITKNLPLRSSTLSALEAFKTFIAAVFYIGKGKRARPYCHLYEAIAVKHNNMKKEPGAKVKHILDIWDDGLGVISLHCFQNVIPVEAYTREACMVDAIGLDMLTNKKRGDYYGVAATWSAKDKRKLGVHLLKKALQIFLAEGERQICPPDIKIGQ